VTIGEQTMSYNHAEDRHALRTALEKTILTLGLSPERLLEALNQARDDAGLPKAQISAATLRRFIKDKGGIKRILKVEGLAAIHEFIISKENNSGVDKETGSPPFAMDETGLGLVLTGFFKDDLLRNEFSDDFLKKNFPGDYVMYRQAWGTEGWSGVKTAGLVFVSQLHISEQNGTVLVAENQDYTYPKRFKQLDGGAMFAYGMYVYFLMRNYKGRSVKLGVIMSVVPNMSLQSPVEFFEGALLGSTTNDVYPRVKIFCRRRSPTDHLEFGLMPLNSIKDSGAKAYLRERWRTPVKS
jgi:hypothetical protein